MSNKLYTEEEIRRTFGNYMNKIDFNGVFNAMRPIELPTDEEIENFNPYRLGGGNYNASAAHKWQKGVEWMRDKIKGGKQ